jgi:hypothetical protein
MTKRANAGIAAGLGVWLVAGAIAAGQARFTIKRAEVLARSGTVQDRNLQIPRCGPGTAASIRQPVSNDAGSERVALTFTAPIAATGWSIAVISNVSGERWSMTAADVAARAADRGVATGDLTIWSSAIRGGGKGVVVTRERDDAQCPAVRVTGLLGDIVQASPSSINKPDDLKEFLKQLSIGPKEMPAWASAIARIRFIADDDRRGYFCTGFLVTPRLMLTNQHCLSSETEAQSAELDFDFDQGPAPTLTVRVRSLVADDRDLDFALVALHEPMKRVPLTLAVRAPANDAELVILQHPSGKIKHASIIQCSVQAMNVPGLTVAATDFEHRCDTEGGSSGSPVHEKATGHVIGLHHWGKQDDGSGQNQAVKMIDVLTRLRDKLATLKPQHAELKPEIQAFVDAALARK